MFDSLLFDLLLVILIGMLSQWIAWRYRMPAIVVMSVAGLLVGPIFGWIDPQETMGELFSPIITFAVAIILFEGSLNLDIREIRGFSKPVGRIVTIGAFIAWIAGSLAAHYLAGLSWEVAFIIGGLFIVTGPTVILPLLRQARLKPRVAAILKWEGIVVDPFGALVAVFAFEFIKFLQAEVSLKSLLLFFTASAFAVLLGWAAARLMGRAFERGSIPEFLKAPILFVVVLFTFVFSDEIMHETGLLAVTAMGMTMANLRMTTLNDVRHFKENISVLLISGIFVMLTASLDTRILVDILNPHILLYVAAMLFVVRPLSIWVSTIGTELTWKERTLVGWIAPRGIVALTVSGYFASILVDNGYQDAEMLTALTFALVLSTVVLHGFSIGWLARKLNLTTTDESGVLLVGGSKFASAFAKSIQDNGHEVLILDQSWEALAEARKRSIPSYIGDILTEQIEYHIDLTPFRYMVAMTESDTYNAHVCADFAPDLGRHHLFQTAFHAGNESSSLSISGGQTLFSPPVSIYELDERVNEGHLIRKTLITKQYSYTQYLRERDDTSILLYILRSDGNVEFFTAKRELQATAGDSVLALTSPAKNIARIKERLFEENGEYPITDSEIEELFKEDIGKEKPQIPGEAPRSSQKE
ncbi:sodium/hydrogen exchanger [Sporosarcina sp. NCCP-2222]|uniref:cation:proton antiporter n=1 Tax=Sporosarcina sp. NCCP-2222 TaxID=2935073 RepID=UPI002081F84A|nr:sodium:proton antiporter [Sporosarcina sp. NCCP-2222]GKV55932.1 sodium/hydrogen exchanger [Sporosarcina sp. NCCP-2222]